MVEGFTQRSIEEWVTHPDALDNLLKSIGLVSKRYTEADEASRRRMAGGYKEFRRQERINRKLGLVTVVPPRRVVRKHLKSTTPVAAKTVPKVEPIICEPKSPRVLKGRVAWKSMLTEKELEIIRGIALGLCNKQIANDLYLSTETVKTHLKRVYKKTGIKTRVGLVSFALKEGFLRWENDYLVMDISKTLPANWHPTRLDKVVFTHG